MSTIEVESVDKTFAQKKSVYKALNNCNLTVSDGQFVSLVGKSGCGKTTLLRIIGGLTAPSRGSVRISGASIEGNHRTDIGMVFQRPVLLPWRNAVDNVLLPLEFQHSRTRDAHDRAMDCLRLVGLANSANQRPYELSGGMQQRVAIARALISEPQILLMDEPFGALDAITRDSLNMELQRIWSSVGQTIVFVTHSIPEAIFLSDTVMIMGTNPGRVTEALEIDLPRQRTADVRYSSQFRDYESEVSKLIGVTSVIG